MSSTLIKIDSITQYKNHVMNNTKHRICFFPPPIVCVKEIDSLYYLYKRNNMHERDYYPKY